MDCSSFDGVKINYLDKGEGPVTLIFLHGLGVAVEIWEEIIDYFSHKYRVIAIDVGGHGKSGTDRDLWTMESFGKDVNAVAELLSLDNVILIGHSMGGAVVLEAAKIMGNRVIGIIGVDTFFPWLYFEMPAEHITAFLAPFKKDFKGAFREMLEPMVKGRLSESQVEEIFALFGDEAVILKVFEEFLKWDLRPILPDISVPIKTITAGVSRDLYFQTPEEKQTLEDLFENTYMENVAHMIFLEKPGEFSEVLEDVISSFKQ